MKLTLFSFIFVFSLISQTVLAQISPGKLAQAHANLEGMANCTKCHSLGAGLDAKKCLQCHTEIRQSIINKSGFHFFVNATENKACFECHSEHSGRKFKLIFWPKGRENFDHSQTGFLLKGKHLEIKCENCHQSKNIAHDPRKLNKKVDINKTFLGLDQDCLSCHYDEHQGQLSTDCLKCHNYIGWKPLSKFDHNKAKFRLIGKHSNVECAKCHPKTQINKRKIKKSGKLFFTKFVGLQFANCTPCHRDVHLMKFGQTCQKCHNTFGWNRINSNSFNHSLTRFPLVGLHRQVACQKCHAGGKVKTSLRSANCFNCHKDIHFGQFKDRNDAGRCESCHSVFGFIPADYDIKEHMKSRYPLTGAHLAVSCVACHFVVDRGASRERRIFEFRDTTCKGCHVDVHKGQFAAQIKNGGCETCHQTSGWQNTKFDHNKTRFPLLGKHRQVACHKCHKSVNVGTDREYILFKPMNMACVSCHKDVHLGQFSRGMRPKTCDKCHLPMAWEKLIFDHNQDALFRLTGAHEKVPCADCHKLQRKGTIQFVLFKPIDRRCINCHGNK